MSVIVPPPLVRGDTVIFVAPSKAIDLLQELHVAQQICESWGLQVQYAPHLLSRHHQQAGTDLERASDLQHALDDPNIRAIMCVRGGYGMSRIIDTLDFSAFAQKPKQVVGFSDITLLLTHLHKLGFGSIHGIMPKLFGTGTADSIESLRKALFGESVVYSVANNPKNRLGSITAPIVGGNLTMLCHSIGTNSELETSKKILFLEDIGEHFYQIDRLLWQLNRAGKLQNLAGLLVGHFTDIADDTPSFGETIAQMLERHTSAYYFPVAYGFPVGHEPHNVAIKIGSMATLDVNEQQTTLYFDNWLT